MSRSRSALAEPTNSLCRQRWPGGCALSSPHALGLGLILIACAYGLMAIVGLPLFGDGAYYFFMLVLNGAPEVPNLRVAGIIPQLPVLLVGWLNDDVRLLRHVFAFAYMAPPVLSLLVCWVVVRRRRPALILLPTLFLVADQVNFSAVSELLMSLYVAWPLVLMAVLAPERRAAWIYAALLVPLLPLLHPLTFALSGLLGVVAWLNIRPGIQFARIWVWLALALLVSGVLRLLWTLVGANAYERSHSDPGSAIGYLLTDTLSQGVLLTLVVCLALLLSLNWGVVGRGRGVALLERLLFCGFVLLALLGILVAGEIVLGKGVKLKAAVTYPIGMLLMALAAAMARRPVLVSSASTERRFSQIARLFLIGSLTILILACAKSIAWWTATHGLMNATASSEEGCVRFGPEDPYALQWPWMAIIDNWAAPINALVFRGPWPIPLLLPGDGCRVLAETGQAQLTSWIQRPADRLDVRFGPLRAADAQEHHRALGSSPSDPGQNQ
ncbi:MAG: hypothetical protein LJE61_08230 [Thiocapsa sp.]|jgi:hypothetical protein|nr:hypothetical protein [Thiocapsa sp.]MCG6985169.1 hypothetical protein [Thiocapsa sp.]